MTKVLILKRDKLGDMLVTTTMIQLLRTQRPDWKIHLLASDYNAWVAQDLSDIDRLWVYRRTRMGKKRRLSAVFQQIFQMFQLRKQHFDVVIVAQGGESDRAVKRGLKVKAKRTIAYCANQALAKQLTDVMDSKLVSHLHESQALAMLLKPLGIEIPENLPDPVFTPTQASLDFADHFLVEHSLTPGRYVLIGLGARRAKKQPSTKQILAISEWLKTEHQLDTVFMWTPGASDNPMYPGDDETAEPVLQANKSYIIPFRGGIQEAIGLIWRANTSLLPDSGMMHFAAASPGGVLGLFAETTVSPSPRTWGPLGPKADYLEADKAISELPVELFKEKLRLR